MKKNTCFFVVFILCLIAVAVMLAACNGDANQTPELRYRSDDELGGYVVEGWGTVKEKTELIVPSSYKDKPVKRIAKGAFAGSRDLVNLVLPEGLEEIEANAFKGCASLTSVVLPNSLKSVGGYVFASCPIKNAAAPCVAAGTVIPISDLETLDLTGGTEIAAHALDGARKLTSVTFPESLERIGQTAFAFCKSLTSVRLPSSVKEIQGLAFWNCDQLTKAEFAGSIEEWCGIDFGDNLSNPSCFTHQIEIGGVDFTGDFSGCEKTIESIGAYAFVNLDGIRNVEIPNGVTSIGARAFWNCENLKKLTIADSVSEVAGDAFEGTAIEEITAPAVAFGSIPKRNFKRAVVTSGKETNYRAFALCGELTSVTLNDDLEILGDSIFSKCTKLTTVTIPEEVEIIPNSAFDSCSELKTVYLPGGIKKINYFAFCLCSKLTDIYFDGTLAQWDAIAFHSMWNSYCSSITVHCTNGTITV